jgi:hypothetical protein
METIKILSSYVAPWGLPKEPIPLHLLWEPSFQYDSIRVKLPSDIVLKEFFNVDSYSEEEENIFKIEKLKSPNFFGFTVASKDIIKDQHVSRKINVIFIRDNKEIYSQDFIVNIYRPKVSLIEYPKSITITEATIKKEQPKITLKLSGFGMIQIRIEASIGGEFVERAEPLYYEITRRMISTFRSDEVKIEEKGIKISPIYIQNKTKEYIEKIEKGVFPLEIERKDLEEFRKWIMDEKNRTKLMELISKQIEALLVDSLLFYFERYPADGIQMPQGKPMVFIESATQKVIVRFRYRDFMLNEYEPIEITINIDDKREPPRGPLELPLNIHWEIEPINPLEERE